MLNYQFFKITQGRGILIQAGKALKRIFPRT